MLFLTDYELAVVAAGTTSETITVNAPDPWPEEPTINDPDPDGGNPSGGNGGQQPGQSTYSPLFDHAQDRVLDRMSLDIAHEIAAKPNFLTREYGAIIWRDKDGILHRSQVVGGELANKVSGWDHVTDDMKAGDKIVAIIHSHPETYLAGSLNGQPIYQRGELAKYLSADDFDNLLSLSQPNTPGYDGDNLRSYLVHGDTVKEYYSRDQDPAKVGGDLQATWAIPSSDFEGNVAGMTPTI